MALITFPALVDTRQVAKRIKGWLDSKGFETRAFQGGGAYTVKARKSGTFRAVVGADRALEIGVRHHGSETQVDVRQGSWKTNAVSNTAWLVVTGGANLLISGWSVVVQKDLEAFVRTVLEDGSGTREVDLSEPEAPADRLKHASPSLPGIPDREVTVSPRTRRPPQPAPAAQHKQAYTLGKFLGSPALWNGLLWAFGAWLIFTGVKSLADGLWRGALAQLLLGVAFLPVVRRWAASKIRIGLGADKAIVYGVVLAVLFGVAAMVAGDEREDRERTREAAAQFAARQAREEKRAALEADFARNKPAVLDGAQRALNSGDVAAARTALVKYAQIADPDLVKLRNAVALAALRAQLSQAASDAQRGDIYSEIARLDPSDTVAVSKAAEHRTRKEQAAATPSPAAQSSDASWSADRCFNTGDSLATVFIANLKTAVEVGMLASEMMERGCQQQADAQGAECVRQCKSGFRLKAKQWVKDGSL